MLIEDSENGQTKMANLKHRKLKKKAITKERTEIKKA